MEQMKYFEDFSEQEISLMEFLGKELPPHRPEGVKRYSPEVQMSKSRDEVPEQMRELWDLLHA